MRFASLAQKYAQQANLFYNKVLMRAASPKPARPTALPRFYTVAGRSLPLKCVPNRRAKRLTLRIESGGRGLRVSAPPPVNDSAVLGFIRKHHGWLEKRLAALPAAYAEAGSRLQDGGIIPVFGAPHRIIHQPGRGITALREHEGEAQLLVFGAKESLPRHIRDFLKSQAAKTFTPLVAKYAAAVEKTPRSISYKDTKTRWGSCSSERKLSFSWRIMMAPPAVADYLAAHEVAHLVEMNHSDRFWALCEKLCPDMRRQRAWLKKNGAKLQAVPFD